MIYINSIDWEKINQNPELFEEFQDKVDWAEISERQKLSEEFIEKFRDKVDWYLISLNQKLSEQFIEKFQDKIISEWVITYNKLSEEFIIKHQEKISFKNLKNYKDSIGYKFLNHIYQNYQYDLFDFLKQNLDLKKICEEIEQRYSRLFIFEN